MSEGRLNNKVFYAIGAIDRCKNLGTEWRLELGKQLVDKYGVNYYNPRDKPIDLGLETPEKIQQRRELKASGQYDQFVEEMKIIRHIDLRMTDKADAAICMLDLNIHYAGTYEELYRMNMSKKPILLWCLQGKQQIPDWLWATLPHEMFFSTKEEMFTYLDYIHTAEVIDDLGRWLFFTK